VYYTNKSYNLNSPAFVYGVKFYFILQYFKALFGISNTIVKPILMGVGFQFLRFLLITFSLHKVMQQLKKYVSPVDKPGQNATKRLLC